VLCTKTFCTVDNSSNTTTSPCHSYIGYPMLPIAECYRVLVEDEGGMDYHDKVIICVLILYSYAVLPK